MAKHKVEKICNQFRSVRKKRAIKRQTSKMRRRYLEQNMDIGVINLKDLTRGWTN